jgi:hypothetical protein
MENQKALNDILSGVLFIIIGFAFGFAASGYEIGTALRMGPGYFPLVLAGLLCLIGIGIVIKGFRSTSGGEPIGVFAWRGMVLLLGALIFFGLTIRGLGLVPSLFITVFASAMASRSTSLIGALVLSVLLVVFCVAIFIYGLGVPLPLLGPWVRF